MNWKKVIIGLIVIQLLSWIMLEVWINHYANSSANVGAGVMIFFQIAGYYVVSRIKPEAKITPMNCPGHDWQLEEYSSYNEKCVKCGAKRGVKKYPNVNP